MTTTHRTTAVALQAGDLFRHPDADGTYEVLRRHQRTATGRVTGECRRTDQPGPVLKLNLPDTDTLEVHR